MALLAFRVKTSGLAASDETVIFILLYGAGAYLVYSWFLYLMEAGGWKRDNVEMSLFSLIAGCTSFRFFN